MIPLMKLMVVRFLLLIGMASTSLNASIVVSCYSCISWWFDYEFNVSTGAPCLWHDKDGDSLLHQWSAVEATHFLSLIVYWMKGSLIEDTWTFFSFFVVHIELENAFDWLKLLSALITPIPALWTILRRCEMPLRDHWLGDCGATYLCIHIHSAHGIPFPEE